MSAGLKTRPGEQYCKSIDTQIIKMRLVFIELNYVDERRSKGAVVIRAAIVGVGECAVGLRTNERSSSCRTGRGCGCGCCWFSCCGGCCFCFFIKKILMKHVPGECRLGQYLRMTHYISELQDRRLLFQDKSTVPKIRHNFNYNYFLN